MDVSGNTKGSSRWIKLRLHKEQQALLTERCEAGSGSGRSIFQRLFYSTENVVDFSWVLSLQQPSRNKEPVGHTANWSDICGYKEAVFYSREADFRCSLRSGNEILSQICNPIRGKSPLCS